MPRPSSSSSCMAISQGHWKRRQGGHWPPRIRCSKHPLHGRSNGAWIMASPRPGARSWPSSTTTISTGLPISARPWRHWRPASVTWSARPSSTSTSRASASSCSGGRAPPKPSRTMSWAAPWRSAARSGSASHPRQASPAACSAFSARCAAAGRRIYATSRRHYIHRRFPQPEHHTWLPPDLLFREESVVVAQDVGDDEAMLLGLVC